MKTPAQRDVFEALFADWCPDHDADWPEDVPPAPEARTTQSTTSAPRTQRLSPVLDLAATPDLSRLQSLGWLLVAAISMLLASVLIWWWRAYIVVDKPIRGLETDPILPAASVTAPDDLPTAGATAPGDLPSTPVDRVWFWQANVVPDSVRLPWRLGPLELALLGLVSLATALAAWWRYRQRFPDLRPPARRYVGYGRQPLPPPARDDSALIEARDRRQLVWQIEHFVSDDPTRHLALAQTADATARAGGFVHLRF